MIRKLTFLTILAALFFGPLVVLFAEAGPEQVHEVLNAPGFMKALGITVLTGGLGGVLSVLLGLAFARPFARWSWRTKRAERLLGLAPYLMPNFILATAYVIGWNPATGLLLNIVPLPFQIYGIFGLTLLFAVVHTPLAFLLLEGKLTRLDGSLTEAARLSGASPRRIFWRIELPLIRPTIISAFALTFALNASAFAIPAWIGAPDRIYTLTYKVYQAIQVGGQEGLPLASVYSLALFLLVLPILGVLAYAQRHEKRYVILSGKAARTAAQVPTRAQLLAFRAGFLTFQLVTFIAPMICLVLTTITLPGCLQQTGLACLSEPTLRSYHYVLFDLAETKDAFVGSGVYGTISALVIMSLSIVTLIFLSGSRRLLALAESLFALLMATPGAIIALGLIVAASGRFGINLYNTPWIVVVAMLLKHQSLAFQPLRTGLANISSSLLEAGRLSGANTVTVWTRIVLPILKPEVTGAFFLALIPILGELTMSIFLASPSYRSLGTVLFDLQDYADHASAGALSVILMLIILAANEAARRFSGGRVGY